MNGKVYPPFRRAQGRLEAARCYNLATIGMRRVRNTLGALLDVCGYLTW
ncbi:MAG: hypothetical protein NVS2B7_23140 [Herpetosiphon sp.]